MCGAPGRACRNRRSSGASSTTSLARSIADSDLKLHSPPRLDKNRSITRAAGVRWHCHRAHPAIDEARAEQYQVVRVCWVTVQEVAPGCRVLRSARAPASFRRPAVVNDHPCFPAALWAAKPLASNWSITWL